MIHRMTLRSIGTPWRTGAVFLAAAALSWFLVPAAVARADDGQTRQPAAAHDSARSTRGGPVALARGRLGAALDVTYRPTVVVRRGASQGSGTIITSVNRETLVLTAAHVVRDAGPILVELHRYNLGLEGTGRAGESWPRRVRARLAALDAASDLTIIRIEGLGALPYVARLARAARKRALALRPRRSVLTWARSSRGGAAGSWIP